jgi:hypothetical protein
MILNSSRIVKALEKLIRKYYDLATIVHSLKQVYFGKHIDNLLVYMVGLISHLYFISQDLHNGNAFCESFQ